jgi:dimethylhistidine N-methyltransferase
VNLEFACDVRNGLSKPQKELPSKYLYDDLGSALFEAITVLPEYGLTRADQRILRHHAREIPGDFPVVAELGSGSGVKTRWVLEALTPEKYLPIDLSCAALARCSRELAGIVPVEPVQAAYIDGLREVESRRNGEPLLLLFLGSTIGNFERRCAVDFLERVALHLHSGDALLIGFDLVKDVEIMLEAYDDPTGVTAAFNLNLVGRINRELDGDFDQREFTHEARWNRRERRIEMHLRARSNQRVNIHAANFACDIEAGETIWTESSHKYMPQEIAEIAEATGFREEARWVDEEWPFAESLWRRI